MDDPSSTRPRTPDGESARTEAPKQQWTWYTVPSYEINKTALTDHMIRLFGNYKFPVRLVSDPCALDVNGTFLKTSRRIMTLGNTMPQGR